MRLDELIALQATIDSLSSSTVLEVHANGVKAVYQGLCSPYVTHKTVEFERSSWPQELTFFRGNRWLVLGPASPEQIGDLCPDCSQALAPYATEAAALSVPEYLLAPLLERCKNLHAPWQEVTGRGLHGLVQVAFGRRKLEKYSEDGKPVFAVIVEGPAEAAALYPGAEAIWGAA